MIEHCPSGLCRHTFGCSRLPGPPPSLSFACYGLFQSRNMFVDKTIQRERSRALVSEPRSPGPPPGACSPCAPRSLELMVKAAFLAEHGVFRRLNPGAERWPSPPDQKQGEHNG